MDPVRIKWVMVQMAGQRTIIILSAYCISVEPCLDGNTHLRLGIDSLASRESSNGNGRSCREEAEQSARTR